MIKIKIISLKKKNNILIVHSIGEFSGSLKSLEEYLKIMVKDYNFYFLTPSGIAEKRLKKYGHVIKTLGLSKFDNSILGYYRGLRWLILLREILFIFPTIFSIFLIKKNIKKLDLIHFNEVTLVPTIFIFKFFFKQPFILHCRILFKKNNYFGKKICKFLKKNIFKIIAIDNDVKNSLPNYLNVEVIRNIFVIKKIKKKTFFENGYINFGYIGSYLKYKGLEDLILIHNKLNKKRKIRLYLAGNFIPEKWYGKILNLSNNINKKLLDSKNIFNMGHLNNIQLFYQKIDVICFPSYLNALGRQIFEAGLYKIPSIVCLKKNSADSFINKKAGLSFKRPGDLKKFEKIVDYFCINKKSIIRMGNNANYLIKSNHNIKKNLAKIKRVYSECVKIKR